MSETLLGVIDARADQVRKHTIRGLLSRRPFHQMPDGSRRSGRPVVRAALRSVVVDEPEDRHDDDAGDGIGWEPS